MTTREQIESIVNEEGVPIHAVYAADGSMIAPVPPEFMTDDELQIYLAQKIPNIDRIDKYGVKSKNPNAGRIVADLEAERFEKMPEFAKGKLDTNRLSFFKKAILKRNSNASNSNIDNQKFSIEETMNPGELNGNLYLGSLGEWKIEGEVDVVQSGQGYIDLAGVLTFTSPVFDLPAWTSIVSVDSQTRRNGSWDKEDSFTTEININNTGWKEITNSINFSGAPKAQYRLVIKCNKANGGDSGAAEKLRFRGVKFG